MKKFFLYFLISLGMIISASETESSSKLIHLNPSAECGIFKNKYGEWSTLPSRIRLSYTRRSLVLEGELQAGPGKSLKVSGKKDDDFSIFSGESFEFQIAPAGQAGIYYHFVYSPSGYLYSARCRDTKWDAAGLVRESRLDAKGWHFRLEVPFKAINTTAPETGEIWRINLARNAENGGSWEYSSLSGASDYHNLQEYSRVVFGADSPAPVLLRSITPGEGKSHLLFAGSFPPEVTLEYETDTMTAPAVITGLHARNRELMIPLTLREGSLPMKTGSILRLKLKNQADGKILCTCEGILSADNSTDLMLDRFYYTLKDKEISFHCNLASEMNLILRKNGKILLKKKHHSGSGRLLLKDLVPGETLPETGRYILTLESENQKISRIFYLLNEAPNPGPLPGNQQLTISGMPLGGFTSTYPFLRRQLLYGGRPYYLFCLSPSYPKNAYLQFENCANFSYYDFGNIRQNSPRLLNPSAGRIIYKPRTGRVFPPEKEYLQMLTDYAGKQTSQPAIHRICYEAQIPHAEQKPDNSWQFTGTDELMFKAYRTLKSANPRLLCSIHTDRAENIKNLSRACDIFEVSFYTSSYSQNMFANIQRDMEQIRREVSPDKPVIFWLGGTIPDKRCRTAEEIRYGVYLSILNGFSGNILHMGHGFLPASQSRLWSLLSGLHAEVESFYPEYAAGKDVTGLLGKFPKAFLCRGVRISDGRIMLLAVNTRSANRRLTLPKADKVHDMLTGAVLPPVNGERRTVFTAYEPRIFLMER